MKIFLNLIDVVFLTRPIVLIPVWGFCCFGYYEGMSLSESAPIGSSGIFNSLDAFAWFVFFSFSVASVYVLNQIADFDVDKANGGLPLLAHGRVSRKAAWISACVCACIGILVPVFKYPALSILACAALILGFVYSFRPLRLSGRFIFDFLSNAVGYGIIAFAAGWFVSGAVFDAALFSEAALPYFLLMCAGSISSTIPDCPGDRQYGKKTTAVVLGVMKAHLLATFILCMAMAIALLTRHYIPFACAACAFPFYVIYFFKRDARVVEATYKIGGFCCMVFASWKMPVLGITAIAVVAFTFIYFKKRHRITYPSLIPVTHEK